MEGSTDHQEWTGVILAGGRARRFGGTDKSSLPVGGRPIVARQLDALRPVTSRRLVVADDATRFASYDVAVVPDAIPDAGPLGGLYSALRVTDTPALLALACDMPFVTSDFLGYLQDRLGRADAVVPRTADGRHVLCVALATRAVEPARTVLAAGRRAVADLLRELSVVEVSATDVAPFDPAGRLLVNINTEDDYRKVLDGPPAPTPA
jgi:molybdopterin-guanine dinucleotide biosynthesis protein A